MSRSVQCVEHCYRVMAWNWETNNEIISSKTPKFMQRFIPNLYLYLLRFFQYMCKSVFVQADVYEDIFINVCFGIAMAMLSTTTKTQYNKNNNSGVDNYSPAHNTKAIYLFRLTQICHYDYHISSASRQRAPGGRQQSGWLSQIQSTGRPSTKGWGYDHTNQTCRQPIWIGAHTHTQTSMPAHA